MYFCKQNNKLIQLALDSVKTVCVYCASSSKVKFAYFDAARRLANSFAEAEIAIVYGGGSRGLMGQLADSMLEAGGKITGVIPNFMCEQEWNHTLLTELILVETMHERKEKMAFMGDAAVALPGGCGTLEELLEVITWKQLGIYPKPIIIVNIDGYYDDLMAMLNRAVEENFMHEQHRKLWEVVHRPEDVLKAIKQSAQWDKTARSIASI